MANQFVAEDALHRQAFVWPPQRNGAYCHECWVLRPSNLGHFRLHQSPQCLRQGLRRSPNFHRALLLFSPPNSNPRTPNNSGFSSERNVFIGSCNCAIGKPQLLRFQHMLLWPETWLHQHVQTSLAASGCTYDFACCCCVCQLGPSATPNQPALTRYANNSCSCNKCHANCSNHNP